VRVPARYEKKDIGSFFIAKASLPHPSPLPEGEEVPAADYRVNMFSFANVSLSAASHRRYTFHARHEERKDF
jgi:hypothetical protein